LLKNQSRGNGLKILITGSNGFIAKNLRSSLETLGFNELLLLDKKVTQEEAKKSLLHADFVFHLAGVNRPVEVSEFYQGNKDYTQWVVDQLLLFKKNTPIVFASSTQVELDNEYGKSKKEAESILLKYAIDAGARIHILRLPNVFGKWARPNYNSVVATFCYNVIRSLPMEVHDDAKTVSLIHVDDVVSTMTNLITNLVKDHFLNEFPSTIEITVGELAHRIDEFNNLRVKNQLPTLQNRFDQQLFSTFTSYLPLEELTLKRATNESAGSWFTELLQTNHSGQVSLNIIQPGVVKGNHWHQTKHEKYLVIQGTAKIRLRKKFEETVDEIILGSDFIASVDIPPGVVHSIENVGQQDLITVMWANEIYDPKNSDTFKEDV